MNKDDKRARDVVERIKSKWLEVKLCLQSIDRDMTKLVDEEIFAASLRCRAILKQVKNVSAELCSLLIERDKYVRELSDFNKRIRRL